MASATEVVGSTAFSPGFTAGAASRNVSPAAGAAPWPISRRAADQHAEHKERQRLYTDGDEDRRLVRSAGTSKTCCSQPWARIATSRIAHSTSTELIRNRPKPNKRRERRPASASVRGWVSTSQMSQVASVTPAQQVRTAETAAPRPGDEPATPDNDQNGHFPYKS
jgi:hypothetical protein